MKLKKSCKIYRMTRYRIFLLISYASERELPLSFLMMQKSAFSSNVYPYKDFLEMLELLSRIVSTRKIRFIEQHSCLQYQIKKKWKNKREKNSIWDNTLSTTPVIRKSSKDQTEI